jgi:hypothetical protein
VQENIHMGKNCTGIVDTALTFTAQEWFQHFFIVTGNVAKKKYILLEIYISCDKEGFTSNSVG